MSESSSEQLEKITNPKAVARVTWADGMVDIMSPQRQIKGGTNVRAQGNTWGGNRNWRSTWGPDVDCIALREGPGLGGDQYWSEGLTSRE